MPAGTEKLKGAEYMNKIALTLIIAGTAITALSLLRRWNNSRARRKYRQEQERYLRKFREGQRSCDEAFEERVREDKPEDEAGEKINLDCKNPALAPIFAKGLGGGLVKRPRLSDTLAYTATVLLCVILTVLLEYGAMLYIAR